MDELRPATEVERRPSLPETVESSGDGNGGGNGHAASDVEALRAQYLAAYPDAEERERRADGGDGAVRDDGLSRRERRRLQKAEEQARKAAEAAARAKAKEDERAAKEAAKAAEARRQQEEKEARERAKEEERAAKEAAKAAEARRKQEEAEAKARAKEEERAAKEAAKAAEARRKEQEKQAKARAKEEEEALKAEREAAERIAKARAKEEARAAKEAAKAAEARRKEEEKQAKARAKEDERAAKEAAKAAEARRKQEQAEAKARAKEEERAAKEAAKAAEARRKQEEKEARARAKEEARAAKEAAKAAAKTDRGSRRRLSARAKGKPGRGGKKLVGLKIGASQIAAARVSNNGAPELVEIVREPLDPGLVVSGEVRDPLALADALKRFFDTHRLPKRGVRLGLSNNRIGVRVFEIEGIEDPQQLENAIRFRAEEVLPIPLEEAVLDYVVLDEETRDDGVVVKRILLVVAYRDAVDRYLTACQTAGIEVVGIDLEAFALLRSLAAPTDQVAGGGALVAIAVGHDRTTIAVSDGRHCVFTRVLDWGGWAVNIAIGRELDMPPGSVEAIKRELSFVDDAPLADLTPEQAAKVREAARGAVGAFARELVASLQFYQAQPGALAIGEILVTGGAAHMRGFPEQLGRLMGVPVRLGDPFRRLKVGSDVPRVEHGGSFAIAIGLGIED